MSASRPSLALVCASEERAAVSPLPERFLSLLERGWDAHLVFDGPAPARQADWPELAATDVTGRVHLSPLHRSGRPERWVRRGSIARGFVRRPSATWEYLRAGGRPGRSLLVGGDVESVLIALRPALVHFDSASSAVARLRATHLFGCKVVVSIGAEDLAAGPAMERMWRDVDGAVDVVHFPSESVRGQWAHMGLLDGRRGMLVAPDPDTAFFDPRHEREGVADAGSSPRALRIVSVGTLSWVYGYEWALQAIRLLVDSGVDCEYRIIGHGPYRDAVSFTRSELGVEDRVELVEAADRARLRQELGWADVLLDATVVAGPPSSVATAQAMALPVVVTERTDLSKSELDHGTGFTVRRRDPRGMADKLALLARDPERRRRMGAAARRRLLERLDGEDPVSAYERLYRVALRS